MQTIGQDYSTLVSPQHLKKRICIVTVFKCHSGMFRFVRDKHSDGLNAARISVSSEMNRLLVFSPAKDTNRTINLKWKAIFEVKCSTDDYYTPLLHPL